MANDEAGNDVENIGNLSGVIGFYAATPVAKQTVTTVSLLSLQTALVNIGLVKL